MCASRADACDGCHTYLVVPRLLIAVLAFVTACEGTLSTSRVREVDPEIAVQSGARRLSQTEVDNTLRDLLGDDTAPATRFLLEDEYAPFDNDYTLQQASGALINAVEVLANDVAQRLVADTARRDAIVPCTPSGPTDETCFRAFLEGFLPRALRRATDDTDIDRYLPLLDFATENVPDMNINFYTAVELAVSATLQDPEFLYRVEQGTSGSGGVFALGDYEIASRMSYLLWGSMPDDALFAAADAGLLTSATDRRAQADRMLGDPKARAQLQRFHAMWLGYRSIPQSAELVSAFNRETGTLIDRVIFDEPGSYLRLFTMGETFVDDALADHYGLPRPDGGQGWVSYAGTDRSGILGHGSLLGAFSKFTDTSPTQRGILVRERLMCQPVPPPPPTIDVDQPPGEGNDDACKYERYAQHRDQSSSCAGCHSLMDPIGFGLENFDIAGRYREYDDGRPECTIDGIGEVSEVGSFSGPAELAGLLVDNQLIDVCAIEHFITFALGREPREQEGALVDNLATSFRDSGHDLRAFLLDLVASERFAARAEENL